MKTLFTILMLLIVSVSFSKPKPKADYKVIWVKKEVLYFKVSKSFIGGVVEVYNEKREFVECDDLPHTHTMIYFDEMPTGNYIVKIRKGGKSVEFKYQNNI
ncbi:MAG TPA: hypothetical protein VKQ08_00435 [Cyclobacteriaceae bacterium]|nr:hypothetical protein [Cyclobacteriaceae bacterium]